MATTPYDEAKLVELVIYVADGLRDNPAGGATKLNKSLWFSEIEHLRRYGRTVTGAEYQKLEWGPAPRQLMPIRERLTSSGDAEIIEVPLGNRTEQRLVPLRPPDMSLFTKEEIDVVQGVLRRLSPMTGHQVSRLSHEEPAWYLPEFLDTIEPELAFLRPAVITPKVQARARQFAVDCGLIQG